MTNKTVQKINEAQQSATKDAIRLNKALGLPYYVVREDKVYSITPDDKEHFVKKALFGTRKVKERYFKLNHGQ
ncbi:MAG: hypothetical protein EPN39_04090 [Chitinophagaceae bacterium]|nr:MAG: hypothetical protein EPN39_04090 [Chitinophagaceae bacterium]